MKVTESKLILVKKRWPFHWAQVWTLSLVIQTLVNWSVQQKRTTGREKSTDVQYMKDMWWSTWFLIPCTSFPENTHRSHRDMLMQNQAERLKYLALTPQWALKLSGTLWWLVAVTILCYTLTETILWLSVKIAYWILFSCNDLSQNISLPRVLEQRSHII